MSYENLNKVHQELIGEIWTPLLIEGMAENEKYKISNLDELKVLKWTKKMVQ